MIMNITLKDILPLVLENDIRLVDNDSGDEICLIRNGYFNSILSEKYSHAIVKHINNDECIVDTVNIYILVNAND